ncbi:MAG TPA: T9SS type A sorting domain-containing protein [Rubricoccaceae bacterium]|jgi:hypothetical protein
MRSFLTLIAALALAPSVSAQEAQRAAHTLPFASAGNAIEISLGGASTGPLTVAVSSAPAWLTFEQVEATSGAAEGTDEPVARLSFDVAREAPVSVPGDIVLTVHDASGTTVGEKTIRVEVGAPAVLSVEPPRPNPSRGSVVVPYLMPEAGSVRVSVFDLLGREVAVLVDGDEPAGAHEARLPAGHLAAGVYVIRVVSGGEAQVARLTVVR